jgi:hypothetical protein
MNERDKAVIDTLIDSLDLAITTMNMCTTVIGHMSLQLTQLEAHVAYLMGDDHTVK